MEKLPLQVEENKFYRHDDDANDDCLDRNWKSEVIKYGLRDNLHFDSSCHLETPATTYSDFASQSSDS